MAATSGGSRLFFRSDDQCSFFSVRSDPLLPDDKSLGLEADVPLGGRSVAVDLRFALSRPMELCLLSFAVINVLSELLLWVLLGASVRFDLAKSCFFFDSLYEGPIAVSSIAHIVLWVLFTPVMVYLTLRVLLWRWRSLFAIARFYLSVNLSLSLLSLALLALSALGLATRNWVRLPQQVLLGFLFMCVAPLLLPVVDIASITGATSLTRKWAVPMMLAGWLFTLCRYEALLLTGFHSCGLEGKGEAGPVERLVPGVFQTVSGATIFAILPLLRRRVMGGHGAALALNAACLIKLR